MTKRYSCWLDELKQFNNIGYQRSVSDYYRIKNGWSEDVKAEHIIRLGRAKTPLTAVYFNRILSVTSDHSTLSNTLRLAIDGGKVLSSLVKYANKRDVPLYIYENVYTTVLRVARHLPADMYDKLYITSAARLTRPRVLSSFHDVGLAIDIQTDIADETTNRRSLVMIRDLIVSNTSDDHEWMRPRMMYLGKGRRSFLHIEFSHGWRHLVRHLTKNNILGLTVSKISSKWNDRLPFS